MHLYCYNKSSIHGEQCNPDTNYPNYTNVIPANCRHHGPISNTVTDLAHRFQFSLNCCSLCGSLHGYNQSSSHRSFNKYNTNTKSKSKYFVKNYLFWKILILPKAHAYMPRRPLKEACAPPLR